MKRNTAVVVGLLLVAAGLVALLFSLSGFTRESAAESFTGVSVVEFDLSNSPIEFRAGGDEVVVDYSFSTGFLSDARVSFDQDGDLLRLEQSCPGIFSWRCQASFEVTLPATAEIGGETSNGTISILGLEGPVDVTTSNGRVTLEEVASSSVAVRTSNGAISGEALGSNDVDVATSNGRIELSFDVAPSAVSARSSNGSIQVHLPSDAPTYAVEASTSNGRVETPIRTDPAATLSITLRTSNGDITVEYSD